MWKTINWSANRTDEPDKIDLIAITPADVGESLGCKHTEFLRKIRDLFPSLEFCDAHSIERLLSMDDLAQSGEHYQVPCKKGLGVSYLDIFPSSKRLMGDVAAGNDYWVSSDQKQVFIRPRNQVT